MPTPAALNAATTHNWVSSIQASAYLFMKPTVDPQLIRRYGDQNMTGLMEMNGGMNPVASLEYFHDEDDWLHSIVIPTTQGGGAAGATVTLTVATAYQYAYPPTATAQSPYIFPNATLTTTGQVTTNPVRLYDIVQFPNRVKAKVTARTSTTFDVTPLILTDAIPATTNNVTQIIIVGNMHPERSGQPDSINSRTIQYSNNMQIFKDKHSSSGSAMGEQIWFEVKNPKGDTARLWFYEAQLRTLKRFKNLREVNMLVGVKTTNNTNSNLDPTDMSTEGLIPFITTNGFTTTYSLINGITRADFETMISTQLDRNRGARENSLWVGINLGISIDRFIGAEMKNGGILYGSFNGDQKKYIDFGFDSFQLAGYTFHKKVYDVFNYSQLLGATGQNYVNDGMVIPMEKTVESVGPNKTKESVPSMRLNYQSSNPAGGNYSRDFEEWLTGAANGVYTNETDEVNYNVRSVWGFEGFAGNRFGYISGV